MNVVIFEDNDYYKFYPISLTKPIWELRMGCFLQRERLENIINKIFNKKNINKYYYFTRDYLLPFFREKYPDLKINDYSFIGSDDDMLFINSKIIPDERILNIQNNVLIKSDNIPLIALIECKRIQGIKASKGAEIQEIIINSADVIKEENSIKKFEFIWDLIKLNSEMIAADYAVMERKPAKISDDRVALIGDPKNLYIEGNVKIEPFVCIDVTGGPVVIREGAGINAFSRIQGPCYIGRSSLILGAKIGEGCSFGDSCRIGGEVAETIFHSYSNKAHDGFIGHSYIGEWVNLGAMTTNSDLKNNYTNIKVYIPDRRVKTDSIKVGCFIGDFTKTSIGTLITTGASIGVGAMIIHSGDLCHYHIPSFAWHINSNIKESTVFNDFIETCKTQTGRRGVDFSENHKDLLKYVFDITSDIRGKEALKCKGKQK